MVLARRPLALQLSANVQQPAIGASTMLGPASTFRTGSDRPSGCPSTTNVATWSRRTHSTLLLDPSTLGLSPATSCPAKTYAIAPPPVPKAHGTGQGGPSVCDQPPCAHFGGTASVSTVPAQPPAKLWTAGPVGLVAGAWAAGLHAATTNRTTAASACRLTNPLHRRRAGSSQNGLSLALRNLRA